MQHNPSVSPPQGEGQPQRQGQNWGAGPQPELSQPGGLGSSCLAAGFKAQERLELTAQL